MRKTAVGTYTGKFEPKNKEKCVNLLRHGSLPIYRSSWEARVFNKLDLSPNVLFWGSELPETIVKYPHPFEKDNDGKPKIKNYHPDIYIHLVDKAGNHVKCLIEVKPLKESEEPTLPQRKTKKAMDNYNRTLASYLVNKSKWKFASRWCRSIGYRFLVLTEKQILNL